MLRLKPIAGFLGRFLILFALLILPRIGMRQAYGTFFRATGNLLFGSYSSIASVRFEPLPEDDAQLDTRIVFTHRQSGITMPMAVGTRFQGYTPTAFVIALVLATPLPWSRRWRSLLLSLAAVTAFIALRQFIFIASVIYHPGPILGKALDFAYWAGVESFAGVFVIPLGIWILVTFRRDDFDKILSSAGLKGEKHPA